MGSLSASKLVLIAILLIFIVSTLIVSSILSDNIPKEILNRIDQLNLKLLDGNYTIRDFAFRRFFRPDYMGELKRFNALKKDVILTKCLQKRRNLLIYLVFSFVFASAAVYFFFRFKMK
jgi:hypothetical protein